MDDFDDWTRDDAEGMDGVGVADTAPEPGLKPVPQINGGLLDPRTFPLGLGGKSGIGYPALQSQSSDAGAVPSGGDGPDVQRQTPAPVGPLDTSGHAEVLRDIQKAQAALPPLRQSQLSPGLRYIDEWPAMNYAPRGRFPAVTEQSLHAFMNGAPEDWGPHITVHNDDVRRPDPDRLVTNAMADMVERAVVDSGFHSININSSVRPGDPTKSNHPVRRAVDINRIDGFKVADRPDLGAALQDVFARQPLIRENFGPGYQVKTDAPGRTPYPKSKVAENHQNHDHFSSQR